MKITKILIVLFTVILAGTAHAGWKLPIKVESGGVTANAAIGMENGAANGYDPGRDVPTPEDTSAITVYFSHPEWGVTLAGKSLVDFYQEVKGESYPAQWDMNISTTLTSVHSLSWTKPDNLPKGLTLYLYPPSGGKVDMLTTNKHTFTPSSSNKFTIQASLSGTTPPLAPSITKVTPQDSSLLVEWTGNDSDSAGYKVHFGQNSGGYERTIDVRDATNLTIKRLTDGTTYYVAVTAYNKNGYESSYSTEAQGIPAAPVQYYAVSGKVKDQRGHAVSGVTVTISTDPPTQTQTDGSGDYSFTNLLSGAYTVTPSRDIRDRFSPRERKVNLNKDAGGVDFTSRGRR